MGIATFSTIVIFILLWCEVGQAVCIIAENANWMVGPGRTIPVDGSIQRGRTSPHLPGWATSIGMVQLGGEMISSCSHLMRIDSKVVS